MREFVDNDLDDFDVGAANPGDALFIKFD